MTTKKKGHQIDDFRCKFSHQYLFSVAMATEMVAVWSTGKEAVSSSPRLVDFAIGLVNSVLKTFEKLFTIRLLAISLSNQRKRTSARTKQLLKKINYPEATFPEINS